MDITVIAIAGGSCSGKTRLAHYTNETLNQQDAEISIVLRQDNYYLDLGGVKPNETLPNFDHPMAFDWELFLSHLTLLKSGQAVDIPTYDFTTHRRTSITKSVAPTPVILVEGILILSQDKLLDVFDHKVFVHCPGNIRLDRRIRRDVAERGRTIDCIQTQFSQQVAPMHDKFVEPSAINADIHIDQSQCSLDSIMNDGVLINLCRSLIAE